MLVTCPLTNSGDSISPACINDVPLLNNTIDSGYLMGVKAIWLDIAQVSDRIL